MVDYLVVGLGLAGVTFCETLEKNGKSFQVISDASQTSSQVAAGMYNPVILKRFSLTWKALEQMQMVVPFYSKIEKRLNVELDEKLSVVRRFASIEEQNLWFEACDKNGMQQFLSTEIIQNNNPKIDAPFGFGEVINTGRINTKLLLDVYKNDLIEKGKFENETFDYNQLTFSENSISYKGISAKHIVFAEGFGLHNNPYFNYLPLTGTKGELLTIKAPDLKETRAVKSSIFIIPIGNDLYRVGATYKWKDKTNLPTADAKRELLEKLNTFLKCDYTVVDHVAGIRPTVTDRRPLVGRHPEHQNLYVLNGFGSRGVMIGPFVSKMLYEFIEQEKQLDAEINIDRFKVKYLKN
ncbi:FAD-binding oxidoreductase [Aurantibacter crassamenti]|uniref:NAD(P)/FAD-dependent oxidoreductase n=1 Tax=Aurantibacter crassamenti TaxID=1837375 RepID=UPI00193A12C0|nr:FAD-binding oxidoreductase [Aurantibacter crassamenti]MBM1104631.1 FAD-binding oxidoreductase [Aurantibacter crassamenti]